MSLAGDIKSGYFFRKTVRKIKKVSNEKLISNPLIRVSMYNYIFGI